MILIQHQCFGYFSYLFVLSKLLESFFFKLTKTNYLNHYPLLSIHIFYNIRNVVFSFMFSRLKNHRRFSFDVLSTIDDLLNKTTLIANIDVAAIDTNLKSSLSNCLLFKQNTKLDPIYINVYKLI